MKKLRRIGYVLKKTVDWKFWGFILLLSNSIKAISLISSGNICSIGILVIDFVIVTILVTIPLAYRLHRLWVRGLFWDSSFLFKVHGL